MIGIFNPIWQYLLREISKTETNAVHIIDEVSLLSSISVLTSIFSTLFPFEEIKEVHLPQEPAEHMLTPENINIRIQILLIRENFLMSLRKLARMTISWEFRL